MATLGGRFQKKGFPDARVDATAKPRPGCGSVVDGRRRHFTIFEGEPVIFGKTIVRGYRKTKLSVIERELGSVEGQPFSLTKTLEMQRKPRLPRRLLAGRRAGAPRRPRHRRADRSSSR